MGLSTRVSPPGPEAGVSDSTSRVRASGWGPEPLWPFTRPPVLAPSGPAAQQTLLSRPQEEKPLGFGAWAATGFLHPAH